MSVSFKGSYLVLLEASGYHTKSVLEALPFTRLPTFYLPVQTASLRSGLLGSHLPISYVESLGDFSKVTKLVGFRSEMECRR